MSKKPYKAAGWRGVGGYASESGLKLLILLRFSIAFGNYHWNKCKKKIIWTPNYAKTCDKNKSLDVSQGYDLLTRPENFF